MTECINLLLAGKLTCIVEELHCRAVADNKLHMQHMFAVFMHEEISVIVSRVKSGIALFTPTQPACTVWSLLQ